MKKEKLLLNFFIISIILVSCVRDLRLKRPNVPLCVNLSSNKCYCAHSEGGYEVDNCESYISTDPESYNQMEEYVDELELRLLKCLNYPKKCK